MTRLAVIENDTGLVVNIIEAGEDFSLVSDSHTVRPAKNAEIGGRWTGYEFEPPPEPEPDPKRERLRELEEKLKSTPGTVTLPEVVEILKLKRERG